MNTEPIIGIVMGSDSDLPMMQGAADILNVFNIPFELTVVSAHRTPDRMMDYAKTARERGLKVIIAGAGGAAHLPGMIAAITSLPVIGVPIKSTHTTEGWDSILSILQMPGGVPVATVALNGSKNAGLLAVQILGSADDQIGKAMDDYKINMESEVMQKVKNLKSSWNNKFDL